MKSVEETFFFITIREILITRVGSSGSHQGMSKNMGVFYHGQISGPLAETNWKCMPKEPSPVPASSEVCVYIGKKTNLCGFGGM